MCKLTAASFLVVCAAIIVNVISVCDLKAQLKEVKAEQTITENRIEAARFLASEAFRASESGEDFIRLLKVVGEVYGIETQDDFNRLIYWTMTLTNGMPYAECRQRIRNGLDGKKEAK